MATNPLIDDSAVQTPQGNPLIMASDTSTPPPPEEEGTVSSIVKAIPHQLTTGAGKFMDMLGSGIESMVPGQTTQDQGIAQQDTTHPVYQAIANEAADRLGLPRTNTKNRYARVVGAGVEAAPGALMFGPEAVAPAMLSGAASQTAEEAGLGPTGQFLAGMAAPAGPSLAAAGIRGLVRGGAEGASNMQENLANASNAGINISAGEAAENAPLRAAETVSSKIPGGKPLANTRGQGLNNQAEASVSNIVSKLAPTYSQHPPTPTTAGEDIIQGVNKRVGALGDEISSAREKMEEDVGGKTKPMSSPKLDEMLAKVTGSTGLESIDNLVTGAKTRAINKAAQGVKPPDIATSYSTDGEGYHVVSSPNGETHLNEMGTGNLRVIRDDTHPDFQGQGEGVARLNTAATTASTLGKNLESDISVSPNEAKTFEKLSNMGWQVTKNPNAKINPTTGNIVSDSLKQPVYSVAPQTQGGATPWTFDALRQLRTNIGKGIRTTRDPGQQGQLKQLYGAVSDDLETGVKAVSPQAEQSYDLFNSVAKQNIGTQKTLLRSITKLGGPEQVFKTAMAGTKDGASKLAPIMGSLDTDGQNLIRATVLHRLGRAGGAVEAPFDANIFMSNYRAMSPEAKNVLFNSKSNWNQGQLRTSLDSLSDTIDLLKQQGYVKSSFAKGVQQGTSGLAHGVWGGVLALLAEKGATMGAHIAAGAPMAAAGAALSAGGTLAFNPIMSRVLTNPRTVAWLAQATKAPAGMMPALTNQLMRLGQTDQDAKDLGTLIAQSKQ